VSQNPLAVTFLKIAAPVGTCAGARAMPPYVTITPFSASAPASAAEDAPPTPFRASATGGISPNAFAAARVLNPPAASRTTRDAPSDFRYRASRSQASSVSRARSAHTTGTPRAAHIWTAARPTALVGAFKTTVFFCAFVFFCV
jgi:hypothetical protein